MWIPLDTSLLLLQRLDAFKVDQTQGMKDESSRWYSTLKLKTSNRGSGLSDSTQRGLQHTKLYPTCHLDSAILREPVVVFSQPQAIVPNELQSERGTGCDVDLKAYF